MAVPEHLTIDLQDLPFDTLLADWRWLVGDNCRPLLLTALGDLFLQDNIGWVYFLDLGAGSFQLVAESTEEFDAMCDNREQRKTWFAGFLVMELRKRLGELSPGQCYSCKIPLSLGGKMEPDNFSRVDLRVHYSILGQLQQQVKKLPPGTKLDDVKIEPP